MVLADSIELVDKNLWNSVGVRTTSSQIPQLPQLLGEMVGWWMVDVQR